MSSAKRILDLSTLRQIRSPNAKDRVSPVLVGI